MYRQVSKSNKEVQVKVKETDPICHIFLFLVTKGHLETWMRKLAILEAKKVSKSRNTKRSASWV